MQRCPSNAAEPESPRAGAGGRVRRAAVAAAVLAGASFAPASAQTTAPGEYHDAATIIVTGRLALDDARERTGSVPGGAEVVGYEDYADKSLVSLRDTLAYSPGVYAQPRYGQEIRISIRGSGISRGFHMRGLTLLQDGVPINLADDNGDFQELEPIFLITSKSIAAPTPCVSARAPWAARSMA